MRAIYKEAQLMAQQNDRAGAESLLQTNGLINAQVKLNLVVSSCT